VIVTRPAEDSAGLVETLRAEGATVLEAPSIEIVPLAETSALDRAVREMAHGEFAWVLFSSPRAVDAIAARSDAAGLGRRILAKVGAVGPATASRVRAKGWPVDLVADPHTTLALADSLPEGAGRVLLPRADVAPEGMEDRLAAKGWTAVRVDTYRTRVLADLPRDAADQYAQAVRAGYSPTLLFQPRP